MKCQCQVQGGMSRKMPAHFSWRVYARSERNGWVLPPLSNSWIIIIKGLFIALNRTPNINCY